MLPTIAGLPGNSFSWMVKANDSWLFKPYSARQSPNLNCMITSPEPGQLGCLPARLNHGDSIFSPNLATPGFLVPSISSLKEQQGHEAPGLPHCFPHQFQNLLRDTNPYLKESTLTFSCGLGGEAALNGIPGRQRRFVIFDHTGNETRLIYSSICPSVQKPLVAATKTIYGHPFQYEERLAAKLDQVGLTNSKLHEKSDENSPGCEDNEMHEDSEEINALLYSDDDDSYYDDDDGIDEVTSTGHSPVLDGASDGMQEQAEELTEEIASSDGSNKRQKLLDGGYKKLLLPDSASSVEKFHGYNSDAESSNAKGQSEEDEMVSILGNKQLRKDKIRATLKILERIVPGAKDKDPLCVLEEAIDYLKSLKLKAKTLGVNYNQVLLPPIDGHLLAKGWK